MKQYLESKVRNRDYTPNKSIKSFYAKKSSVASTFDQTQAFNTQNSYFTNNDTEKHAKLIIFDASDKLKLQAIVTSMNRHNLYSRTDYSPQKQQSTFSVSTQQQFFNDYPVNYKKISQQKRSRNDQLVESQKLQEKKRAQTSMMMGKRKLSQARQFEIRDKLLLEDCLNKSVESLLEKRNKFLNKTQDIKSQEYNQHQLQQHTYHSNKFKETNQDDEDISDNTFHKIIHNLNLDRMREKKWLDSRQNLQISPFKMNQTQVLSRGKEVSKLSLQETVEKRISKSKMDESLLMAEKIFDQWLRDYKISLIDNDTLPFNDNRSLFSIGINDTNGIPMSVILKNFLTLGLVPNQKIFSIMANEKNGQDPSSIIFKEQFLQIFKSGSKIDKILTIIKDEVQKIKDKDINKRNYDKLQKTLKESLADSFNGLINLNIDTSQGLNLQNLQQQRKNLSPKKRATIGDLSKILTTKLSNLSFLKNKHPSTLKYLIEYDTDEDDDKAHNKLINFIKRCSIQKNQVIARNSPRYYQNNPYSPIKDPKHTFINKNKQASPFHLNKQHSYIRRRTKINDGFLDNSSKITTMNEGIKEQSDQQDEFVNRLKMVNKYYYEHGQNKKQLDLRKSLYDNLFDQLQNLKEKIGKECRDLVLTIITLIPLKYEEVRDFSNPIVLPLMQLLVSMLSDKLEKDDKNLEFPNEEIGPMFQIIEKWWAQMDPMKMQVVPKEKVENFLQSKGILNDPKELDSIIRSYFPKNQLLTDNTIKKSVYMRIMSCAIMRGMLINLNSFLNLSQGTIQSEEQSLNLKVLKLQRIILMKGIKAKSNIGIYHKGKIQKDGLSFACASIVDNLQNIYQSSKGGVDFKRAKNKIEKDIQGLQKLNTELKLNENQNQDNPQKDQNADLTDNDDKLNNSELYDNVEDEDESLFQYCDRQSIRRNKNPIFDSLDSDDFDQLINDQNNQHAKKKFLIPQLRELMRSGLENRNQSAIGKKRISLIDRQKIRLMVNTSLLNESHESIEIDDLEQANMNLKLNLI
ncbi:UNKNOWN [Stylonychia lemnae]|uniref:Uncharacterized protein n=1 Tax=Stylonychia lemnae TaxID=5949 RepID=A0A078AXS3_STYLE|nr:UNKNOWN [Stylonychia lemnae]|eukprot:CDW85598.1 UNKNOWN [Stylonychia lemnae]